MTQLQENIYKQEYDRLILQPVNEITRLELEHLREYLRTNNTAEVEKEIICLENAMQADEDKIDLYQIFQRGLNAAGAWEEILNDFSVEYEERSNSNLIQSKANHILSLLKQNEEEKVTKQNDYIERLIINSITKGFLKVVGLIDTNTSSGIFLNYCHLYRSFHCVKQKYMQKFLQFGYQAKNGYYLEKKFSLFSNYITTQRGEPKLQLTKELLDGETERVIAEINGCASRYGARLNDAKFRPAYRYLLEMAIKQEARLRLTCDTVDRTIHVSCQSVVLYLGSGTFGTDKIPCDVEISYVAGTDMVALEFGLTNIFVSL